MIRTLRISALYLWQLPQVLLGYIMLAVLRLQGRVRLVLTSENGVQVWASRKMRGAISLGMLTIHSPYELAPNDIRHELGHTAQSRLLGPLYLPIIGLPSLLHAWLWHPKPTTPAQNPTTATQTPPSNTPIAPHTRIPTPPSHTSPNTTPIPTPTATHNQAPSYYDYWTERWADHLGGVHRQHP